MVPPFPLPLGAFVPADHLTARSKGKRQRAYSDRPAALRASAWLRKSCELMAFPPRKVMNCPSSWLNSMPVVRPVRSI